jgi:hypothetical protein
VGISPFVSANEHENMPKDTNMAGSFILALMSQDHLARQSWRPPASYSNSGPFSHPLIDAAPFLAFPSLLASHRDSSTVAFETDSPQVPRATAPSAFKGVREWWLSN